jgi:hypothetical protein
MSALIKVVDSPGLSGMLREAHVELTPRESRIIEDCHKKSFTTWVGYNGAELVCVWGIIPPSVLSDEVYLWLYATGAVRTNQFLFVRHSQLVIEGLLGEYRAIVGYVTASQSAAGKASRRWLQWLGAEIMGPLNEEMLNFRIERHGNDGGNGGGVDGCKRGQCGYSS